LSERELAGLGQVKVNGSVQSLPLAAKTIRFAGEGSHRAPLRWEVT
jgi:hypothetical protein